MDKKTKKETGEKQKGGKEKKNEIHGSKLQMEERKKL